MIPDGWFVNVITPPATEPVTRTEAKAHLRVDFTTDDTYIDDLIATARHEAEKWARRALITQTLELRMPYWPNAYSLALPRSPVQSITSITYTDDQGNTGTMS